MQNHLSGDAKKVRNSSANSIKLGVWTSMCFLDPVHM